MRVAVVIVTHKMLAELECCLKGVVSLVADPKDLIFVDNGSDGHIGKWAEERFPKITTIRLIKNRLFCGGYNAGIRVAIDRDCDFVLLVNADAEVVNPGFVSDLLRTAERWPRAAFIGPLVYFRSPKVVQRTCLEFPGIVRSAATWLPWRVFPGYFRRQPGEETVVEVLNGVCVLCRVRALREFGLMDENMGGYAEDYDWAWRARERGWVSVFAPVASVLHHENPAGYESFSLKTFLQKRNTVYWYLKTGRRHAAWLYVRASVALASARLLAAGSSEEGEKHRYFFGRLTRAFSGLLEGEPLGEWFGPPIGSWESGYEL
jgi:N-acetylglucosaminyl-diphospho-decaprenol L-rhamnosyltransferase